MIQEQFCSELASRRIVAVVVIDDPDLAVPLARTLLTGGVTAIELTLRTPRALQALERVRDEVPGMLRGVGTILTPAQVDEAQEAGAQFGVAPGFNRRVVERATHRGLPFGPGVMTPSEIEGAVEMGCRLLKFFPAESSGGLKHLHTMAAPYQHLGLRFIPLGGVDQSNLQAYLTSPIVAAIGGSWIAPRYLIQERNWAEIASRAKAAMEATKESLNQ